MMMTPHSVNLLPQELVLKRIETIAERMNPDEDVLFFF